jgi:hypothetical protein
MSLLRVLGVAGLVLCAIGTAASPAAATSCSGPEMSVTPSTIAPGTTTLLSGYAFGTDCTNSGLGPPAEDVEIVVRVGNKEKVVGQVDVGADYDFVIDVHIPPSLGTGSGAITARSDTLLRSVEVPIEVAGSEGDHGDRPYAEWDGTGPDPGVPWGWIAAGAAGGAALMLGLVAIVGRRSR